MVIFFISSSFCWKDRFIITWYVPSELDFTPNECEKRYLSLPKEERILLTSWSLTNKDVNLRTLLCRIECALSDNKTIALRRYMYNQLRRNEMCKKIQYTCTLRTKTVNCHIFIIRYHHNFFFRNALQMKI